MTSNRDVPLHCLDACWSSDESAGFRVAIIEATEHGDAVAARTAAASGPPWPNQVFPDRVSGGQRLANEILPPAARIEGFTLARPQVPASQAAKLAKVTAYVDRMLRTPNLTVATIAVGVGISRSALYRHFGSCGGIARFVRDRRIAALRRVLDRVEERRPFVVLARDCGFVSAGHASRRFKSRYGMTPSAYRDLVRAAAAPRADARRQAA